MTLSSQSARTCGEPDRISFPSAGGSAANKDPNFGQPHGCVFKIGISHVFRRVDLVHSDQDHASDAKPRERLSRSLSHRRRRTPDYSNLVALRAKASRDLELNFDTGEPKLN